jgi:hypothetical protein
VVAEPQLGRAGAGIEAQQPLVDVVDDEVAERSREPVDRPAPAQGPVGDVEGVEQVTGALRLVAPHRAGGHDHLADGVGLPDPSTVGEGRGPPVPAGRVDEPQLTAVATDREVVVVGREQDLTTDPPRGRIVAARRAERHRPALVPGGRVDPDEVAVEVDGEDVAERDGRQPAVGRVEPPPLAAGRQAPQPVRVERREGLPGLVAGQAG